MTRTEYRRAYARAQRANIRYTVDAEPFRSWAREAWRHMTLPEMAYATGLSHSTLRKVMWGDSKKLRIRTAGAISALRLANPSWWDLPGEEAS